MKLNRLPNFGALLKSHFFAGLLVVVPLGVIAWIAIAVLRGIWQIHELLPVQLQPENILPNPSLAVLVNIAIAVGITMVLALAVSILGWISKQYLGKQILKFLGEVIRYIPVIRTIYSALDQFLRTLAQGGGQQFSRVVYIEYPRKGTWTLAFVTGQTRAMGFPAGHLNVYVPTTPNPTSGFFLIVPESDVKESQMKVEDAFKTILSLGIAQSGEAHL